MSEPIPTEAEQSPARRTKRRYAHELYPHAEEGQTRPLHVEVPYLYAQAIGLEVMYTDWLELGRSGRPRAEIVLAGFRTMLLIEARRTALLADALLQGMSGQEAWAWADERSWDEAGECVYDRAEHYGIPFDRIKPYPVLDEPRHHNHWSEPDARGARWLLARVEIPESECEDCTEPVDGPIPGPGVLDLDAEDGAR